MKSALWMSGALFAFSLMAIAVKELGHVFPLFEMLFFRSLIGLIALSAVIYWLEKKKNIEHQNTINRASAFKTVKLNRHIFRNIIHFAGQWCWMFGLLYLPLAEVFALEFTTPMWTLIFAVVLFKETFSWRKVIAVVLGLTGVALITQPSSELFNPVTLIVLLCGVFYALSLNITKTMVKTESVLTILFYMSVIQLPIGFVGMLNDFVVPTFVQSIWVLCIALTALVAHFCISKAMMYGEVSTVMTVDFIRLPLIMVIGFIFYQEQIDGYLLLGAVIMLVANWINLGAFKPWRLFQRKVIN